MRNGFWLLFLATAGLAFAGEEISVKPGQISVQVNGIVCSFCAHGAEKNLSRLPFVDPSRFGKDGVLVDINSHRVTLAIKAGERVDLGQITKAIRKGGYDPVSLSLHLSGKVEKQGERYLLRWQNQLFALAGKDVASLNHKEVSLQVEIDAKQIASHVSGNPLPVTVVKVESAT